MKDLIKQKVIDYTPELLKYLDELVSYPSVFSDDALPFGQANIDCLNHALEIGSNLGFKAVNVDISFRWRRTTGHHIEKRGLS